MDRLGPASLVRSRVQWREYSRLRSVGLRGEGEGRPEDKAQVLWFWRGGGQESWQISRRGKKVVVEFG